MLIPKPGEQSRGWFVAFKNIIELHKLRERKRCEIGIGSEARENALSALQSRSIGVMLDYEHAEVMWTDADVVDENLRLSGLKAPQWAAEEARRQAVRHREARPNITKYFEGMKKLLRDLFEVIPFDREIEDRVSQQYEVAKEVIALSEQKASKLDRLAADYDLTSTRLKKEAEKKSRPNDYDTGWGRR